MNKLYALIVLFLAQSICAMENEQPEPRVFSFFNGGNPFQENTSNEAIERMVRSCTLTNEQATALKGMPVEGRMDECFKFCLANWKQDKFGYMCGCPQGSTAEAKQAYNARKEEIESSAKQYDINIRCAKIVAANFVSYVTIDPLFEALGQRFFAQNNKGIVTVRDVSVPATSLLLATGIRLAEYSLGHAVFNSNMRKPYCGPCDNDLPVRDNHGIVSSIIGWLPTATGNSLMDEFKVAAMVSILRIAGHQAMLFSGVTDRLQAIKTHMTKNNSKLSNMVSNASVAASYVGRPLAHALVDHMLHNDEHYRRYTMQPNCPN